MKSAMRRAKARSSFRSCLFVVPAYSIAQASARSRASLAVCSTFGAFLFLRLGRDSFSYYSLLSVPLFAPESPPPGALPFSVPAGRGRRKPGYNVPCRNAGNAHSGRTAWHNARAGWRVKRSVVIGGNSHGMISWRAAAYGLLQTIHLRSVWYSQKTCKQMVSCRGFGYFDYYLGL